MSASVAKIRAEIAAERFAAVYCVYGECFERDRLVQDLRNGVLGALPASESTWVHDRLEAKTVGAVGILNAAQTLSMFGGRRLVEVQNTQQLSADDLRALLPYLDNPAEGTVIVFVADKIDLRLKFFSKLKKMGVVVRFDALKERDASAWLSAEASRQGWTLAPGVAFRIVEIVGSEKSLLASALDQVGVYGGGERAVTVGDVEFVLAQTRQRSIFEVMNAVGKGQRERALSIVAEMSAAREPALRIISMLARHLRQVWTAGELQKMGKSKGEIARALGINPYFIAELIEQSRSFDRERLLGAHRALFTVDRDLKTSRVPDRLLLEELILNLCPL